jgi:hypothetical protein
MGFGRKTNNPNTQNFVWAFAITDHIEGSCTDLRLKKKKKKKPGNLLCYKYIQGPHS